MSTFGWISGKPIPGSVSRHGAGPTGVERLTQVPTLQEGKWVEP
jgi:hypothetical protein